MLARRYRYHDVSAEQWDRMWEAADNEWPHGTGMARSRANTWRRLADWLRKLASDAGDPLEALWAQVNRSKAERDAAARARLEQHEATKGAELHPSIATGFQPGSQVPAPNGGGARMSRAEVIDYLRPLRGSLEAGPWRTLLERYEVSEADLDQAFDEPDFGTGPEAGAHG